jgi:hypothetical protein
VISEENCSNLEAKTDKFIGDIDMYYNFMCNKPVADFKPSVIYKFHFPSFLTDWKNQKSEGRKQREILKYYYSYSWAVQEVCEINNVYFFTLESLPLSPKASQLVVCKSGIYSSGTSKPLHIRYTCTAEIKFTTLLGVRFNT